MRLIYQNNSVLKTVLCLFFIVSALNLYSQTAYKVTYYVVKTKIHGSIDDLDENGKELFKRMVDYTKSVNYILTANQTESFFEREDVLEKESDSPIEQILSKSAQRFTSFNDKVYNNRHEDSIVFVRNIVNKDFTVKRNYFDFNWILKDDVKKILGFDAMKAEGTYNHPVTNKVLIVEAWYIPSIPLQYGPDIFNGLPGLIAEVDLQGTIVTMKKIDQIKNSDIEKIDDSKAMTQQEFENLIKGLNKKFEDFIDN